MKLKIDEKTGLAVVVDGKPVYIDDSGQEIPYDVPAAQAKIGSLNAEAKANRLKAKALEDKLEAFGDLDVEAAREAIQFKSTYKDKGKGGDEDTKKLIDAAVMPIQKELDRIKTESEKALKEKDDHIYKLEVSNRFTTSEFIKGETIFSETPDVAEAYFGKSFKIEDGKVVAYDGNGQQIFSKIKPGELADFDEALSELVQKHPKKEHILKSKVGAGSGAQGSGNEGKGKNAKTIKRSDFEQLSASEKVEKSKAGIQITD